MATESSPLHPPGKIWTVQEGDECVLFLQGEIDAATVTAYELETANAPTDADGNCPSTLLIGVIDVASVTFLNSVGVSFLVGQTQTTRDAGHHPALRGPSGATRRILDLTGVSRLFD